MPRATVGFCWLVWEEYPDTAPEPFGDYIGSPHVKVGDIIQLHWLDGRSAGYRRVVHVHPDRLELHVVESEQPP